MDTVIGNRERERIRERVNGSFLLDPGARHVLTQLPLHLITPSNFMSEFALEGVHSGIQLKKRVRKKGE